MLTFRFTDLAAAIALLFVFEGIMPFLNPSGLKRTLARLTQMGDRELRIAGLGSMLVGVLILFLVR
ncbi:MAG: DUF2065 domain-containing protein [Steroidobacteraceae bacterium]